MSATDGLVSSQSDRRQRVDAVRDALVYAGDGYPVVPLVEDTKRPATRHGKDDATTDTAAIGAMFKPGDNVGIAWPVGVSACDVDPPKGDGMPLSSAREYVDAHGASLEDDFSELRVAPKQRTVSGGLTYVVRLPAGVTLPSTVKAVDFGDGGSIDLRGDGRTYNVVAPSRIGEHSYHWERQLVPVDQLPVASPELLAFLMDSKTYAEPSGASDLAGLTILDTGGAPKTIRYDTEAYARGILAGVRARLGVVKKGRNDACRRESVILGRWVGAFQDASVPGLTYEAAFEVLLDAMKANGDYGDDPRKAEDTIARGLRDGIASPYVLTVKSRPSTPTPGPAPRDPSDPGPSPTEPQEPAVSVVDTATKPATSKPTQAKHAPPEVIRSPLVTRLSTVDREDVERLDGEGRLMIGKPTIMLGDPGVGKTFVSLSVAANITRGLPVLPLQLSPESLARPAANVLALIGEDGVGDTIRPRFEDAGGDPDRFFALTGVLETSTDAGAALQERDLDLMHINEIEAAMKQTRPLLVIIDPLTHFFGVGADANKGTDVRQNMRGVVKLAERYGFALLILHHMNKGSGKAIYRGVGSIQFAAYARSMLVAAQHQGAFALAQSKANLGPLAPTLTYTIDHGRLEWMGTSVVTADQLTTPATTRTQAPARATAAQWLAATLAGGPMRADQLRELAERDGIASWRTVNAAKVDAKVGSRLRYEEDGQRYWEWYLE